MGNGNNVGQSVCVFAASALSRLVEQGHPVIRSVPNSTLPQLLMSQRVIAPSPAQMQNMRLNKPALIHSPVSSQTSASSYQKRGAPLAPTLLQRGAPSALTLRQHGAHPLTVPRSLGPDPLTVRRPFGADPPDSAAQGPLSADPPTAQR
eukprot:g24060.t1